MRYQVYSSYSTQMRLVIFGPSCCFVKQLTAVAFVHYATQKEEPALNHMVPENPVIDVQLSEVTFVNAHLLL